LIFFDTQRSRVFSFFLDSILIFFDFHLDMFLDFIFCNLDLNLYNSCFLSLPFLTYLDLSLAASCVHMVDMSTTHTCSFGSKFAFVA